MTTIEIVHREFEFPKTHKKAAQLEKTKNPIGKLFFSSWEVCE